MTHQETIPGGIKILMVDDDKKLCRVLTRDQLLNPVAGRGYDVFDRSVDVHISSWRRKLGEDPCNPRFIRTVRTAGYMFKDLERQKL